MKWINKPKVGADNWLHSESTQARKKFDELDLRLIWISNRLGYFHFPDMMAGWIKRTYSTGTWISIVLAVNTKPSVWARPAEFRGSKTRERKSCVVSNPDHQHSRNNQETETRTRAMKQAADQRSSPDRSREAHGRRMNKRRMKRTSPLPYYLLLLRELKGTGEWRRRCSKRKQQARGWPAGGRN
jgi:hypothetical protein